MRFTFSLFVIFLLSKGKGGMVHCYFCQLGHMGTCGCMNIFVRNGQQIASPVVNVVAPFVNSEHMGTCGCMNIFVRNGQQIERGGNLERNSIIPILSSVSRNFLPNAQGGIPEKRGLGEAWLSLGTHPWSNPHMGINLMFSYFP
jgi:hypothetical protein